MGSDKARNQRTNRDRSNYSIDEIGQNIKENPGHLRKLTVSKNPVKHHRQMLMCKNYHSKRIIMFGKKENYEYLEILESDTIKQR